MNGNLVIKLASLLTSSDSLIKSFAYRKGNCQVPDTQAEKSEHLPRACGKPHSRGRVLEGSIHDSSG
jgi:hypothetical protein